MKEELGLCCLAYPLQNREQLCIAWEEPGDAKEHLDHYRQVLGNRAGMDCLPTKQLDIVDPGLNPGSRHPHKLGLGKVPAGAKAKDMTKVSALTPSLGRIQELPLMLGGFGVVSIPLHSLATVQQWKGSVGEGVLFAGLG